VANSAFLGEDGLPDVGLKVREVVGATPKGDAAVIRSAASPDGAATIAAPAMKSPPRRDKRDPLRMVDLMSWFRTVLLFKSTEG
jgi:hypothetical protein